MSGKTHRIESSPECPSCGARIDCASGIDHDQRPRPGCVIVCFYCAVVLRMEESGHLRLLTAEEETTMDPDLRDAVLDLQRAIAISVRERGTA